MVQELKQLIDLGFKGQAYENESMNRHTYYRIGGPATLLVVPKSLEDLSVIKQFLTQKPLPFFFLGRGSNLLVSDQGYDGCVIKTTGLNTQMTLKDLVLETGGSVAISSLLRKAGQEGWGGLEMLAGIPGLVGGAVFMNAGTHLGETKDTLESIQVFDFGSAESNLVTLHKDSLNYSYRKNHYLTKTQLVWSAFWKIKPEDPKVVSARLDEVLKRRKQSQPIDFPSCGSVFKNPLEKNMKAWEVIDRLGLRGHQIGDAQFSEKHPNFIVNHGKGKAKEVRALIELAKSRAQKELGIRLEEEVCYLGKF